MKPVQEDEPFVVDAISASRPSPFLPRPDWNFRSGSWPAGVCFHAMAKSKTRAVDRRGFLKGAAAAAALVVKPPIVGVDAQTAGPRRTVPPPSPGQVASETSPPPPRVDVYTVDRPGSDFMVDVIKSLGFEYVAANPGSTFRGLHESLINYGGNKSPELLTCCHEESSVAMAHGYAKIEGKPMMVMAHGTVGLQHASMAIYNAYADRVPVYIVLGNILDVDVPAQRRRVGAQRAGRGGDGARLHQVGRHAGVAEALRRIGGARVQDRDDAAAWAGGDRRRRRAAGRADAGGRPAHLAHSEADACRAAGGRFRRGRRSRAACWWRRRIRSSSPAACARTPNGIELLVELAETLQAPVQDRQFRRMNFPTRHPLYGGGSIADADVILGLEVPDFWNATHAQTPVNRDRAWKSRPTTKAGREADHHFRERPYCEEQLSGLRALRGSGPRRSPAMRKPRCRR